MPWCPNCGSEYREGFSVCSDCLTLLVEECPRESQPAPEPATDETISLAFLTDTDDSFEADMLIAMLESEGITTMKKLKAAGGYLKVYMGMTVFGSKIYVSAEDFQRATELIEAYFSGSKLQDEPSKSNRIYKVLRVVKSIDEIPAAKIKNEGTAFEKRRRIVRIIILAVLVPNIFAALLIAIMQIWNFFVMW